MARAVALALVALVAATEARHWCYVRTGGSLEDDEKRGADYRGTYRDVSLYVVNRPSRRCTYLVPAKKGDDGLWVLELDTEARRDATVKKVKAADIPIVGSVNLSLIVQGGEAVPDKTDLDACGAEKGVSVIPVPTSTVRHPPPPSDELSSFIASQLTRKNALITRCVAAVSKDSLVKTVDTLQNFNTRNSYSNDIHDAQAYLEHEYTRLGFTVSTYEFRSDMSPNVIAELKGTTEPNKIVVVGAHYDSRSTDNTSPTQRAPGADDNASGTSALLEIARLVHSMNVRFQYTLRLISFSGEEQGLLGSRALAAHYAKQGEDIAIMFNADMLGYQIPGQPITLGFKDRSISHEMTEAAMGLVKQYVGIPTGYSSSCCSDYMSFHENGYLAVGFFENEVAASSYPHYHTSTDLLRNINPEQLRLEVQGIVATVFTFAKIVPLDVVPKTETWVFLAPRGAVGGAEVPGTNTSLVATAEPRGEKGWVMLNIDSTLPKYLMKAHNDGDKQKLAAAYGKHYLAVPGTDNYVIVATEEVEERKAHGCGVLLLKPIEGALDRTTATPAPLHRDKHNKAALMEAVSASEAQTLLRQLSGSDPISYEGKSFTLATRYSFVDMNRIAAEWIGEWLMENAGCDDLLFEQFTARGSLSRNVICVKQGTTKKDDVVVVGAHFDGISSANGGDSSTFAPAAIDNGSGTVNVMLIAKALKEARFERTVHFVLFSGEEQGLYGSTHYVDVAVKEKRSIVAALIMDMTAYSHRHFGVAIEGSRDSHIKALMNNCEENIHFLKHHVGTHLTFQHNHISFGSDHVPFQRAGMPAILLIEQDDTNYPGYHRTTDTVSYANYDQMRDIARVLLGQVVDYAA